jgi:4-amino-4-deoxy-L-arabinose transferase-like glycosyltransferase
VSSIGTLSLRVGASERVRRPRVFWRWVVVALVGMILVALAVRLSLLLRSNWLLEGDDALSALMALSVLDGDRPIMLKNQTYAGAWEPYAMAVSYALFGISRVSAKLPALVGSMALIGTTSLLAREVAGTAAACFAAVLAALPPVYVLVLSLKPWAPYTEVIVFGTLCLTCALRLAWPGGHLDTEASAGPYSTTRSAPARHDGWWALACGVCGGLALWMHPLAVAYLIAALIVLVARVRGGRWSIVAAAGLAGFSLGGLPIWLFNVQTGGATFRFVANGTQGQTADRGAVLAAWWNNDLPRGAGLWHPWGPSPFVLGFAIAIFVVVGVFCALVARRHISLRPLDGVLILLTLMPTLLVFSGFGGPALNPYGFDATGRYTPPIWSALAVVLGSALGVVWQVRRAVAVGLSLVPLAVNAAGLQAIDPLEAFQSPYWDRLPADNAPLLAILRDEHVNGVWMNHWAGQPLMFDARANGQALIAYDWYDVEAGGIDRYPEYRPLVEQAERPAFVLVTDEAEPELERTLRLMGITFVERRSSPYVVVIPTSRRVHPSEVTAALDYRY